MKSLSRVVGWSLQGVFGLIVIFKVFISLVGLSTIIEDTSALPDRSRDFLKLIAGLPDFWFYLFFIFASLVVTFLLLFFRPSVKPTNSRNGHIKAATLERDGVMKDKDNRRTGDISTENQSGGFNNTGEVHFHAEDRSLKRRIRNVLGAADPRILDEIDNGAQALQFRMTLNQFARFEKLLSEQGSAEFFQKVDRGISLIDCTINNGSLGPTTSEHEQVPVIAYINQALRED